MYISRQIESFQGLFVFLVLVHRTHPPVDSVLLLLPPSTTLPI